MGILIVGAIALAAWALSSSDDQPARKPALRSVPMPKAPTQPAAPAKGDDIQAAIVREEQKRDAKAVNPDAPIVTKAPFSGPTPEQWGRYVGLSVLAPQDRIEPDGRLGVFLAGPNQLAEDGMMQNVRRRANGSGWDGDWIPPHTQARFLGSRAEQFDAFQRQAARHASAVRARHAEALGSTPATDLPAITLSGLMGVARHAGLGGLDKWLKDKGRKPDTTAIYRRFNGIF